MTLYRQVSSQPESMHHCCSAHSVHSASKSSATNKTHNKFPPISLPDSVLRNSRKNQSMWWLNPLYTRYFSNYSVCRQIYLDVLVYFTPCLENATIVLFNHFKILVKCSVPSDCSMPLSIMWQSLALLLIHL